MPRRLGERAKTKTKTKTKTGLRGNLKPVFVLGLECSFVVLSFRGLSSDGFISRLPCRGTPFLAKYPVLMTGIPQKLTVSCHDTWFSEQKGCVTHIPPLIICHSYSSAKTMSTVNACRSRETRFSVLNGRGRTDDEHGNGRDGKHVRHPRAHRLV